MYPVSFAAYLVRVSFWAACLAFGFLSLIPTSSLSSGLFDWWDKAQHALAFFCLSISGTLSYQKSIGKVLFGLILYGALIEALQWFSGIREGQVADWFADFIGAIIGGTLTFLYVRRKWYLRT